MKQPFEHAIPQERGLNRCCDDLEQSNDLKKEKEKETS